MLAFKAAADHRPLTRPLQRTQRVDLPFGAIGSRFAAVTSEQDDAVAHSEQPFETPAG